jgi:hypothetical protein
MGLFGKGYEMNNPVPEFYAYIILAIVSGVLFFIASDFNIKHKDI